MRTTTLLATVGLAVAGGARSVSVPAQHPDMSGKWTYNAGQSDSPRDRAQAGDTSGAEPRRERGGGWRGGGFGGSRGGFGGRRGGFGGGGMGGAEGGGGISDEQRARMRQTLRLAFEAPMTLTIAQSDSTVTLVADTTRLVLYSDGRKLKQAVAGGGDVEIKGRWQGNDFVVERQVSGGGKVTEDYQRAPDGKRLYVLVNLDPGRGRSVDFRRIYEPAGS